jgi:hypothetical protein
MKSLKCHQFFVKYMAVLPSIIDLWPTIVANKILMSSHFVQTAAGDKLFKYCKKLLMGSTLKEFSEGTLTPCF